jgi:glycosyltransferase involved in cell wall biosynthesis
MMGSAFPPERQGESSRRPVAYVLVAHDPVVDPRIEWFASTLMESYDVYVIGACSSDEMRGSPRCEVDNKGTRIVKVDRNKHDAAWLPSSAQLRNDPSTPRALLGLLTGYAALPEGILADRLGAQGALLDEVARFRGFCAYFVNTNSALMQAMQNMGPPDLIVAADLETLPAATAVAGEADSFCVYDAHEYWPYSYTDFQSWEIEFWLKIDRQLSRLPNLRLAVSQQLADIMAREYGCEFLTLPNCARLAEGKVIDIETAFALRGASGPLKIIFLGNFAEGRGLEETLRAFAHVRSDARLILQGRDNPYRRKLMELTCSLGLGEERVSFPPAVPESALVETAAKADIGLIPYDPAYLGYRYCCPNKLSQYLAAGLPILSSSTEYVSGIVRRERIGHVVDIADPLAFAAIIDSLVERREELVDTGRRARQFFEERYHWEAVVSLVLSRIEEGCKRKARRCSRIELDWISAARARRELHGTAVSLDPALFGADPPIVLPTELEDGATLKWLRGFWHLLPSPLRYAFVGWLSKVINQSKPASQ